MNENELLRAILGLCQQWVTNTSGSPPVNTVAPALTSNADINNVYPGDILSCDTGTWTNSPTGYIYDFKYNSGTIIQTGPSNTYTVLQSDIGHPIHCTVTASNGSGSGTADSNTSGNVFSLNTNPPAIDNPLPQVGETMYVSPGTWVGTPTLTYQWQATGVDIPGATSPSFLLTVAEEGDYIRCNVTANGVESILSNTTDGVVAAAATGPCVLKLYADTIAGVVTDPVATWPDKSGNGNDATATLGHRPTIQNGNNGTKAVLGDGVSSFMTFDGMSSLTEATLFMVFKNAVNGLGNTIYSINNSAVLSYLPYDADTKLYDAFFTTARKDAFGAGTLASGWNIYEALSGTGDWRAYVNGTQVKSTATNTIEAPLSGSAFFGNGGSFCNTYISALIIFGALLTDPQRASVEAYLKAVYATP